MATPLNDIANRLTPSVPMEITYAAQPIATGRKFTTIFGHMAASPGSGTPYQVYPVINVGNAAAALAEVNALAGAGSEIGNMVVSFINANALAGAVNFPAFRVVLMPHSVTNFGPSQAAFLAVQNLRSDMLVSCYPASDSANETLMVNFANQISGVDRDLAGQFGTFMTLGSLDAIGTSYAINSRTVLVAHLPDSNTALVTTTANTTSGSAVLSVVASITGIYKNAGISGTGIPTGALVGSVSNGSVTMVDVDGAPVLATATGAAVDVAFQNVVSQHHGQVAAAFAGRLMAVQFPYPPVQGVVIGGLIAPQISADLIQINPNGSSEAELVAGNSPLVVQANGNVAFIRSRTTLTLLPDNVTAATAYIDWQDIVTLYDYREDIFQVTQQPPFNNNPGGSKATVQLAGFLKDEMIRIAGDYEDENAFQNVKALAPFFVVQPSTTSRGRFDFRVPADVVPGLFVIAGNIVAISDLSQLTAFTL